MPLVREGTGLPHLLPDDHDIGEPGGQSCHNAALYPPICLCLGVIVALQQSDGGEQREEDNTRILTTQKERQKYCKLMEKEEVWAVKLYPTQQRDHYPLRFVVSLARPPHSLASKRNTRRITPPFYLLARLTTLTLCDRLKVARGHLRGN